MRISEVKFKNFASYGNRIQTIKFKESSSDLYLVLGQNGAGKSTLAKVITYLLYGKVEGSNLKDLPNRVNGELWGCIKLESKGNQIEIERGISPGVFNVTINGSVYDVAGKTNLQEFLDVEMYEIPYHVFKNVIILSVNDFKSFITMSPYDKKQIIDRIFGFSAINEMRDIIKGRRKLILDEIKTYEDEIRTLSESIESVLNKIEHFENLNKKRDNTKITNLKNKLIKLNERRKKLKDINEKLKYKVIDTDKNYKEYLNKKSEYASELKSTNKALQLYNNNVCPTCQSPLDSEFHQNIKTEKNKNLDFYTYKLNETSVEIKKLSEELNKFREHSRQVHVKIGNMESDMLFIKNELISISEESDSSTNHFKDLIKEFKEKKQKKESDKFKIEEDDHYLTLLENLMGEDGIKNLAVRTILPSFNNNILIMSKEMGIPFSIRFDDKFNCTLNHLGQEISPKTLSTGEKKKVDFVIIMALIKMIKLRFSGLNVLFLDEIFSSIDSDGVYHIINILHNTIRDIGLNTFVINHTVLPSEYFDKKIEITKDAGFSEFKIETIK